MLKLLDISKRFWKKFPTLWKHSPATIQRLHPTITNTTEAEHWISTLDNETRNTIEHIQSQVSLL